MLVGLAAHLNFSVSTAAPEKSAMMVVEAHSGKVLIARNSTAKRPVASLTKIATGVLVTDWAELTGVDLALQELTVPASAAQLPGPNPMKLVVGERLTLIDALSSAMMGSDNIAAQALAHHVGREFLVLAERSGDPVEAFVSEMNELAKALEMKKTRFDNPHGLELGKRMGTSTAADMAKLSVYAMRKPALTFVTRQATRKVTVNGAQGARTYQIKNTNTLVSDKIIGLKTGTTRAAGPCLALGIERPPFVQSLADDKKAVTPRRLVIVLLNTPNRFQEAKNLILRGWGIYDQWFQAGAVVRDPKREILHVPDPAS